LNEGSHYENTLDFRHPDSIPFGLRSWPAIWTQCDPFTDLDEYADFNTHGLFHIDSNLDPFLNFNTHPDPYPKTASISGDSHARAFSCYQPREQ